MPPVRSAASGLAVVVAVVVAVGAAADVHGSIHDHTALPEPGESFGVAEFRIFVPDTVPRIRGVMFRVAPHLYDSRPEVQDPALQQLAAGGGFALMGARLDDVHMETGIGEAVLRTLAVFAAASGRPELAYATLYFEGYSWGGQFSYHFTQWRPERVIGFVTMKGGYHSTMPAGDAILVPGYLFIGEYDLTYRIENLTGIFEAHRPLGARWILAVQPDAGHEPITDRDLLDDHFQTVSHRRLPADWPPDMVPELQVIPEEAAWLGDRADFRIGAWDCYDAASDSACWLVTRRIAKIWQDFVSGGAVADTIPCAATASSPRSPESRLVSVHPNPANPATEIIYELAAPGRVNVAVFDARGHRIARLVARGLAVGRYAVRWDGRRDNGKPAASGIYFCRLTTPAGCETRKLALVR